LDWEVPQSADSRVVFVQKSNDVHPEAKRRRDAGHYISLIPTSHIPNGYFTPRSPIVQHGGIKMTELIYPVLGTLLIALMALYASLCARL
jgi:hypothetical protein